MDHRFKASVRFTGGRIGNAADCRQRIQGDQNNHERVTVKDLNCHQKDEDTNINQEFSAQENEDTHNLGILLWQTNILDWRVRSLKQNFTIGNPGGSLIMMLANGHHKWRDGSISNVRSHWEMLFEFVRKYGEFVYRSG